MSVRGGPPITICNSAIPRGASWGDDGTIVFATADTATGLLRVPAAGGEPAILTSPDPTQGERDHGQPMWLPAGRGVVFTIIPSDRSQPKEIAFLDLRNGQRRVLLRGGSQPEYLGSGHLLYTADGNLIAVRFDLDRLEVHGDPMAVVADVLMNREPEGYGEANYEVSRQGTLVYVEADSPTPRSLAWIDRTGRETPIQAPPRMYASSRLSPDGSRVAVEIRDRQSDIHVLDLELGTLTRLAPGPNSEQHPIWSADGQRIIFASQRDGGFNLFSQAADGSGTIERLTRGPDSQRPAWAAPDGRGILGSEISPKTAGDIVWFPIGRPGSSPPDSTSPSAVERLVQSMAIDYFPDVSPDGRYIAYQSNESGQEEIYVRPFPNVSEGVWSVSTGGGMHPVWAKHGRELYYLDPSSVLMAVPVQKSAAALRFGNPIRLFQILRHGPYNARQFDVDANGRFLVVKQGASERASPGLVVAVNWIEELADKLPARP